MVEQYSDCDFETLLAKYDYNFKRGDIVKGIVCAYEADGAIVDIGSKSTAFVPVSYTHLTLPTTSRGQRQMCIRDRM